MTDRERYNEYLNWQERQNDLHDDDDYVEPMSYSEFCDDYADAHEDDYY